MDAAPRGLAPCGPGATGAPLVDWVLADHGLANAVFADLAPVDVLGLRASCRAAKAAVAGHPWEYSWEAAAADAHSWMYHKPEPPVEFTIREQAGDFSQCDRVGVSSSWICSTVGDRAALIRWRACFPTARSVVVREREADGYGCESNALTDADVAALAGGPVTHLQLIDCDDLTDAVLAPFTRLSSLALIRTGHMSGACWAGMAGRLRAIAVDELDVTDAHLPALAGCTHVDLGEGAAVTDAGVAHLSRAITHLTLNLYHTASFDGSCLRGCRRLVDLRLLYSFRYDSPPIWLVPDALAGRAATLTSLELATVDGGDALLVAGGGGLPALRRASLRGMPTITGAALHGGTTPRLAELVVDHCDDFVDVGTCPLPRLTHLEVVSCPLFTGRALTAGRLLRLQWLAVRDCSAFAEGGGGDDDDGGGGGSSSGNEPLLVAAAASDPALPALRGAFIADAPALTDAWFVHAPSLTHLVLEGCGGVVGGRPAGARLTALVHLSVEKCGAFTGAWLGRPGRLQSLFVSECAALRLSSAPAQVPQPRHAPSSPLDGSAPALPLADDDAQLGRLAGLRQLTLHACDWFVGSCGLGARLPRLARLVVDGCTNFTGAGLAELASLQRLVVHHCPRVGAAALVAAARGCPLLATVKYKQPCNAPLASSGGGHGQPPPVPAGVLGSGWATVPFLTGDWDATRLPWHAGGGVDSESDDDDADDYDDNDDDSDGSGNGGSGAGRKRRRKDEEGGSSSSSDDDDEDATSTGSSGSD